MIIIGIDFDNTLARYDDIFNEISFKSGFTDKKIFSSKTEVKKRILASTNGEKNWQKLQGKVYGRYMNLAKVFAGAYEFICLAKLRGYKIFIVSHKSEYGHFDEKKISLRNESLKWLIKNDILNGLGNMLTFEDVYFESTREDKIKRINTLGCTHFIDDLPEIFLDKKFPKNVQKIFFCPYPNNCKNLKVYKKISWSEITKNLLGSWDNYEIIKILQIFLPELLIINAIQIEGRGNSKVFKLESNIKKFYLLKLYPDLQYDERKRLDNEFQALSILYNKDYPVPKPIAKLEKLNWGVFEWIDGESITKNDKGYLKDAINFISKIKNDTKSICNNVKNSNASEACLSGEEIEKQINKRIQELKKIKNNDLYKFLNNELANVALQLLCVAKKNMGPIFKKNITKDNIILSPSDFGAHNALRIKDGKYIFIDFEYFGIDDPVKLVSDFYWHPGMIFNKKLKNQWLNCAEKIFQNDITYIKRLDSYLPLYGIRWCLIILNRFKDLERLNQSNSSVDLINTMNEVCATQMIKSKMLLKEIRKTFNVRSEI